MHASLSQMTSCHDRNGFKECVKENPNTISVTYCIVWKDPKRSCGIKGITLKYLCWHSVTQAVNDKVSTWQDGYGYWSFLPSHLSVCIYSLFFVFATIWVVPLLERDASVACPLAPGWHSRPPGNSHPPVDCPVCLASSWDHPLAPKCDSVRRSAADTESHLRSLRNEAPFLSPGVSNDPQKSGLMSCAGWE